VGFVDDEATRARTLLALERGWLRAWVLYVDERPVAFWMGDAYRGRFRSMIPGYDPDWAVHRVGNFILMHMIERLCEDPDVQILDFGFGDVEYKERLAERNWSAGDVFVFAPTFKGVRVNLVRSTLVTVNGAAMRLARSLGIAGRVKRTWRRRFARRQTEAAPTAAQGTDRADSELTGVGSATGG
jgi:CelD/BcsL family acetyltransferase involved in cellulose biosynthesis